MSTTAFRPSGLDHLRQVVDGHVGDDVAGGQIPSVVWALARGDEVEVGVHGRARRDTIFRISSMTKPIVAVAALLLVERGVLELDQPIDDLLPELADRRVLRRPGPPFDDVDLSDTVPADRPITVEDVLTFRLGWGMDFTAPWPQPIIERMGELELGAGPPEPDVPPGLDEWLDRLGTLPLQFQPGERWLYNTGADVLGALIARATGGSLATFLADEVFGPLGMGDTGFHVPDDKWGRFGAVFTADGGTYDLPDGRWSSPPAFPSGAAGLVSTVDDYVAFATMLRRGGDGLLSPATVAAMTTNRLTAAQLATGPGPDGSAGWGLGVGVQLRPAATGHSAGTYGWSGGLGSQWDNDPARDLTGVLLTDVAWESPVPPPIVATFWTGAYAALT